MYRYYVNDNSQTNGDHEVHTENCPWIRQIKSKTSLGNHSSCHSAVIKAKHIYKNVNGCAYCCTYCHKK